MIVRYKGKLEKELDSEESIRRNYGGLATYILHRLSELYAADNLSLISSSPPPRREKLSGLDYTWSVRVGKNYRMLLKSDGENDPRLVTSVEIISIKDYHSR